MNTKQALFSIALIGSIAHTLFSDECSQEKSTKPNPIIFNNGWSTKLDKEGNTYFDYVVVGILRKNSYTFPKTVVIAYEKDSQNKYKTRGTLADYAYENRSSSDISDYERDELTKTIEKQNAVHCPCLIKQFNKDNEEHEVIRAIIYGTRNPKHCKTIRQIIKERGKLEQESSESDNNEQQ